MPWSSELIRSALISLVKVDKNQNGCCGKTHRLGCRWLRDGAPLAASPFQPPPGRRSFTIWSPACVHVFLRARRKKIGIIVCVHTIFVSISTMSRSMETKSLSQNSHVCSTSSVTEHTFTWGMFTWKCGGCLDGDALLAPMLVSETAFKGLRSDNFPNTLAGDIAVVLSHRPSCLQSQIQMCFKNLLAHAN
jgi:hypothetical protein